MAKLTKPESWPVPETDTGLFTLLLAIRLANSVSINTFFQADEYWQALEPAHYQIFGYGYLTWEWRQGIRSFMHPLLYVPIYKICQLLRLDYAYLLYLPKLMNALICAVGETFQYKLTCKWTKDPSARRTMFYLSLFSPFNWYCYCRSFSNSLELALTTIALFLYPETFDDYYIYSMIIAGFCCIIRPTNGLIWLVYGLRNLRRGPRLKIIVSTILIGIAIFSIDSIVNRHFYGAWTIPSINFLNFNVSRNLSSFYGTSRLDFYFFQAIPVMLLTYLPYFIIGLLVKEARELKLVLIINLLAYSLIQHKEFRFIYPLMPILLFFTTYGVLYTLRKLKPVTSSSLILLIALLNITIAFYFTQIHESGVITVTQYLRDEIGSKQSSIGFLTPCHSTPFQSHFHLHPNQVDIWFLTCEPPLHLDSSTDLAAYRDESDEFYDDTLGFLQRNFPSLTVENSRDDLRGSYPHTWPEYLIFFESLEQFMKEYLHNSGYSEYHRIFNSRFHWDSRRTGDVIIYKLN
ncbi:hypothetical protein KL909_000277 [Ogataea angusta]|uniref:Mannosyltransferase n=1 Tax=Pichia angusta TaxID=870730 RepID=A0AAN6DIW2_PICAN|nr:uncharacterized protein KL928_001158 [Ogataea angusta]KAG7821074.1 hypothetical protein KL928_001158 [Ogataea angusta]KAG7826225.1 hypothetical protein KL909_000277 [Ogataea angusta]KAG7836200.1 hypothetical protein KL943_001849 [Ogataea angusta]